LAEEENVTREDNQILTRMFDGEEIKEVVFSIGEK
jgi:hypothetical protein